MLKILAAAVLLAIGFGLATGGHVKNLARIRLLTSWLLYVGLVAGLIPLIFRVPSGVAALAVGLGYGCVAIFLAANILASRGSVRLGFLVLLLGWGFNALPVLINHGMPLSLSAYYKAGLVERPTPSQGGFFKVVIATHKTHFNVLGDTIPIHFLGQVVSAGDVLLITGIVLVVAAGMQLGSRRTRDQGGPRITPQR